MKTITISTTYTLKWVIKDYPNYMVTDKGIVINLLTNRILKRVVNGGSKGYWFGKDFITLNDLRKLLVLDRFCPF